MLRVCVCTRARAYVNAVCRSRANTCIYTYVFTYVCMCVRVRVSVSSTVPTGVGCVHFDTIPRSMYQMYVNEVHGAHRERMYTSERGYVRTDRVDR